MILALVLFLLGSGAGTRASAATAAEKDAFKIAMDFLSSTFYQRAEAEFAKFVAKFPESDKVPEAILRQAQARYFMTNYAGTVELITGRLSSAGPLADQYLFLRGEAEFKQSSYPAAADTFSRLVHDYPGSPLRLQAAVEEAAVYSAMSDWRRVIDLSRDPKGVFQIAASTNAAVASRSAEEDQLIVRGYLLLGEALFAQGQLSDADDTLDHLVGRPIESVPAWQWQYLRCRIRIAQGRLADALEGCANLLTRAEATGQPGLKADSISFEARLLVKMERPDEAITTFAENLKKDTTPPESQREALLNIAALSIARNNISEATTNIERFLAQFPASPASDLGWFTLGELRLRQRMDAAAQVADGAVTNAAAVTNFLRLSREAFARVVNLSPPSPLRGRAEMNLGWCGWLADDLQASAQGFQGAIEHLPVSMDQAQARYKLGDVRFRQNQFKEAESNYLYVADKYNALPDVATNLVEPALYQAVRSGLRAGDIQAAHAALTNILARFPDGFHSDDAVLLFGRDISQRGYPNDARSLYSQFLAQAPEAALRPEVELGIARTWEEQEKWPEAVRQYESWLAVFTNHPARPRAEYFHALALTRVGDTTNALICFTNFVAHFPNDTLAPLAQWHVGNIERNQGDLKEAEKQFQLVTKGPPPDLPFQARIMAGKCAEARQVWKDAAEYFTSLYNDTNCPLDLRLESLLLYGDLEVDRSDTTNKISDYEAAIRVFTTIVEKYPTNRIAALAWGQKAICLMQWAHKVNQPDALTNALASFQNVLESPQAGVTARGLARIGLGIVLEKMAEPKSGPDKRELQERALEYYAEVCFGSSAPGGERPDPFCAERAGLEAIRLAEDLQEWQKLSRLCDRLEGLLPSLHDTLLRKKQKAQENLARAAL